MAFAGKRPGSDRLGVATPRRALPAIGLVALSVLGAVIAAQVVAGIPVRHMFVDTRRLGELPLYAGAVSYLGILAWAAAGSICLFAATVVSGQNGSIRAFLVRAGALSTLLCIDDLWELHDRVVPAIAVRLFGTSTGEIGELLTLAVYAALALAHFGMSIHIIRRTQWWLLAFAVASFGVMVVADVAIPVKPDDSIVLHFLDDGAKLIGILAWLVYHADAARALVSDGMRWTPPDGAPPT